MKIALIIPTLDRSGAEKQLTLLACGLAQRGLSPHVFALDRGGPYADDLVEAGVPVTVIGKRGKVDVSAARRLSRSLKSFEPDVVHTWLFSAHAYGRFASRGLSAKWVQSLRCVDSWKSGWQRLIDRRLWPSVDRFVANSVAVQDWYVSAGVPASRIDVVRNGVPVAIRGDDSARPQEIAALPDGTRVVLCVGRLAPQKRLKDLLWGFQLVRQANERVWLVIVGDGPQRAELKEYARDVEAGAEVTFVGHRDDPTPYFEAADVFWMASDFEGQSNSLQEAMSFGLPVVVSDIEPNRELVEHNEQGYIVDVGDSAGFAQFTTRLLGDPPLAERLGCAGRAKMEEQFGVDRMVDAYAALYAEAVGGS